MSVQSLFNPAERSFVAHCFNRAERLTGRFFQIGPRQWPSHRYDVRTLAQLESHEVRDKAFAHLCKYSTFKEGEDSVAGTYYFYRICLHDDRILDAVERGNSFIKLVPLMLYIATHELVHILRFEGGESDFDMPTEEREKEEGRVDAITRTILSPWGGHDMNLVLDCFGSTYRIGDVSN